MTFFSIGCKLCSEAELQHPLAPMLIKTYFKQKYVKTDQVSSLFFCYQNRNTRRGPLCLRILLGVSLSSGSRFLVGPSRTRMGNRPAFFVPEKSHNVTFCASPHNSPLSFSKKPFPNHNTLSEHSNLSFKIARVKKAQQAFNKTIYENSIENRKGELKHIK